ASVTISAPRSTRRPAPYPARIMVSPARSRYRVRRSLRKPESRHAALSLVMSTSRGIILAAGSVLSPPCGLVLIAGSSGGASGSTGGGVLDHDAVGAAFLANAPSSASDFSRSCCGVTPSLAAHLKEHYGRSGPGVVRLHTMHVPVVLVIHAPLRSRRALDGRRGRNLQEASPYATEPSAGVRGLHLLVTGAALAYIVVCCRNSDITCWLVCIVLRGKYLP